MINVKKFSVSSIAALGLFAIGGPASAGFFEIAPDRDVDLCVAKVQENADYTGAARVHHEIESSKRRGVGYSLEIDTSVFGGSDGQPIREYTAVCVVTGGKKPLEFSIREKDDAA